jgi:tyrosine-protein phosphatase ERK
MQNTIYEFWLMVKQNIDKTDGKGVQKIAMLTDFIESSRHKCAAYFPCEVDDVTVFTNSTSPDDENYIRSQIDKIFHFDEEDQEIETVQTPFNYFVVKNLAMIQKNDYSIRKFRIFHGSNRFERPKEFSVYHYWFPDWPDHRSPEDIDVLLDLSLDLLDGNCVRDFDETCEEFSDRHPLPIIHCSAGIGRTGCLAAILNGLGQLRSNSEETSVDILGIVCNLRLQRGGMVQNSEQYELIHRSICLYHHKMISKLK